MWKAPILICRSSDHYPLLASITMKKYTLAKQVNFDAPKLRVWIIWLEWYFVNPYLHHIHLIRDIFGWHASYWAPHKLGRASKNNHCFLNKAYLHQKEQPVSEHHRTGVMSCWLAHGSTLDRVDSPGQWYGLSICLNSTRCTVPYLVSNTLDHLRSLSDTILAFISIIVNNNCFYIL